MMRVEDESVIRMNKITKGVWALCFPMGRHMAQIAQHKTRVHQDQDPLALPTSSKALWGLKTLNPTHLGFLYFSHQLLSISHPALLTCFNHWKISPTPICWCINNLYTHSCFTPVLLHHWERWWLLIMFFGLYTQFCISYSVSLPIYSSIIPKTFFNQLSLTKLN